jgi:hypothetical protein
MPHRIPPANILLQTFFNNQQQQQSTKHTHTTTTTTTQQHWPLTITLTMARTPTKCKKKDDNIVINTPTKCKKGGSKVVQHHAATSNANDPQASTNGTSPPAAGASSNINANNTKVSGTNRTDGTIDAEADEDNANAKKMTDGTINAETDEDDANAKKTTDGTINADTDDDNADAKMMGDKPPYAQQAPQSQRTTNRNAAESDSTQANKVALCQNVSYFVTFSLMHTIAHVILC